MRERIAELVPILGLSAALGTHALFGVPAPAEPGLVEALTGMGLMTAAGVAWPLRAGSGALLGLSFPGGRASPGMVRGIGLDWRRAGCAAAAILLWVPLLRAAVLGNEPADILRDVVPLGFLFLPLLLGLAFLRRPAPALGVLVLGLACIGLAFALRRLAFPAPPGTPAAYLANGPAVAFAAVWLPLAALSPAGTALSRGSCPGGVPFGPAGRLVALAGGMTAFTVLVLDVNRSTVAACLLALAVGGALRLRPARLPVALPPLLAFLLFLAAAWEAGMLGELARPFVEKTGRVGDNGRVGELAAVAAVAGRDWPSLLFGAGWGALMENPAVGGWTVSYTHGLPGYLLLKTGLTGCLAGLLWAAALAAPWLRLLRRDAALALAVAAPVVVGTLAHTGYKHLCFGLLLCLPVLAEGDGRRR